MLTRPDAPSGRGRRLQPSPVAQLAAERGIPTLQPRRPSEPDFLAALQEVQPDCCPVVAYGALLPKAALAVPEHGWVNLHFSLLPAWRGAAPVAAAIRHGDDTTGASAFLLEEGMDTGPVFGTVTERIGPRDTAGELLDRLSRSGARLLAAVLDGIEAGTLQARPQPADGVSYAPKLTAADARVDWTAPATAVDRLVRSVTPEPGAWTEFRGERLGLGPVLPSEPTSGVLGLEPGELRVEKRRVLAGTATRAVELGDVHPVGKRAMPAADWARGIRVEPREALA